MNQPGQPSQPRYQPQQWPQNPTAPSAAGYPEPTGNYLAMQQFPPTGEIPQQATGHLRVHLQGSVITSSMITPTLEINGQPVKASYGPNDFILPAGPYHVSAYGQWMRQYGQAALDVALYPRQTTDVFYAAPLHQFTAGSIGFTKQPRRGLGFLIGLLGAVFAAIAVVLVLALLINL